MGNLLNLMPFGTRFSRRVDEGKPSRNRPSDRSGQSIWTADNRSGQPKGQPNRATDLGQQIRATDRGNRIWQPNRATDPQASKHERPGRTPFRTGNRIGQTIRATDSGNRSRATDPGNRSGQPNWATDIGQQIRATDPGNQSGQPNRATDPGNRYGQPIRATDPANRSGQPIRATDLGNRSGQPISGNRSGQPIGATESGNRIGQPILAPVRSLQDLLRSSLARFAHFDPCNICSFSILASFPHFRSLQDLLRSTSLKTRTPRAHTFRTDMGNRYVQPIWATDIGNRIGQPIWTTDLGNRIGQPNRSTDQVQPIRTTFYSRKVSSWTLVSLWNSRNLDCWLFLSGSLGSPDRQDWDSDWEIVRLGDWES